MTIDLERYYADSYPPSLWNGGGATLTLTSINPNAGVVTGPTPAPFLLTCIGTGFTDVCVVFAGGVQWATTFVDETTVTAMVTPTGWDGPIQVTVYDTGTTEESNPRVFTATAAAQQQAPTTESEYAMSDTPTEPDTPPEGEPEAPTEPEAPST